jgi:hypothetical protein
VEPFKIVGLFVSSGLYGNSWKSKYGRLSNNMQHTRDCLLGGGAMGRRAEACIQAGGGHRTFIVR